MCARGNTFVSVCICDASATDPEWVGRARILEFPRRPRVIATNMSSSGRILIVEDDPSVRRMLAEYLGTHGYEIVQVDRGTAMREAIEKILPDVVLLDVNLPG